MIKNLLILVLSLCVITLVGCGGSGSSDSNLDTYQVFSNNLIQQAEDNTNLNDYKNATIYFTNKFSADKKLKDWDEEAKFKFNPDKSFNENLTKATTDEENGTLTFGNHTINSSSREYLLKLFEIDNLIDLDGLTYHMYGQGYKSDNNQLLYLNITDFQAKN